MKKKRRGFTLIELIIVITVIGILALIALPKYFANLENARKAEAISTLKSIAQVENLVWAGTNAFTVAGDIPAAGLTYTLEGTTYSVVPNTTNFTYSLVGSGNAEFAKATKVANKGTSDYYMCLESSKTSIDVAPTCP